MMNIYSNYHNYYKLILNNPRHNFNNQLNKFNKHKTRQMKINKIYQIKFKMRIMNKQNKSRIN